MTTHGCWVLTYANPNFNETAMRAKIAKNLLIRDGKGTPQWTYRTLFQALELERDMCAAVPEDKHQIRKVELNDQLIFMREHAAEYGCRVLENGDIEEVAR